MRIQRNLNGGEQRDFEDKEILTNKIIPQNQNSNIEKIQEESGENFKEYVVNERKIERKESFSLMIMFWYVVNISTAVGIVMINKKIYVSYNFSHGIKYNDNQRKLD
jgi:hypothetical protein